MDEVTSFLESLSSVNKQSAEESIDLLRLDGFNLSMPDAKPVGGNLWELRVRIRPAIRILYGFRKGIPILLVAFRKQKSAIPRKVFERAKRVLYAVCN